MWLGFRNHSTPLWEWQMHYIWTPLPPPHSHPLFLSHLPPQLFTSPIISFFFSPCAFIQPFFSSRHLQNSWKTSRPILVSCSFKHTGLNCHQWLFSLGFGTPQGPFVARGDLAKTGTGLKSCRFWPSTGDNGPTETKTLSPYYRLVSWLQACGFQHPASSLTLSFPTSTCHNDHWIQVWLDHLST